MWQAHLIANDAWQYFDRDSNGNALTLATIRFNIKRLRKQGKLLLGLWTNTSVAPALA